ncbi:MAG: hypothetical protein U0361_15345 [Nitrospiraceae bacterium]
MTGSALVRGCCLFLAVVAGNGLASAEEATSEYPALSGLRSPIGAEGTDSPPAVEARQDLVRQAPSISGKFQVRDQTFLPFVGAGFSAGYASERDRALGTDLSSQSSGLLGNGLSKGFMPNEFQMGIKIPF